MQSLNENEIFFVEKDFAWMKKNSAAEACIDYHWLCALAMVLSLGNLATGVGYHNFANNTPTYITRICTILRYFYNTGCSKALWFEN